jgi:hypothetical protein
VELAIILLLLLVSIALVLAWSIGLGWLLSHLLPFSLFEGSLLAMAASVIVGYIASRVWEGVDLPWVEPETPLEQPVYLPSYAIPYTRFYPTETDKTWKAGSALNWPIACTMPWLPHHGERDAWTRASGRNWLSGWPISPLLCSKPRQAVVGGSARAWWTGKST